MSLLITIPVHDEEGWAISSPPDSAFAVRARLEAAANSPSDGSKSAEDLRRAEEAAAKLRAAHVEAVAALAGRQGQRVAEARARRLRREVAAKETLQARFDAVAQRERRAQEEKSEKAAQRAAKREALIAAVKSAQRERERQREDIASASTDRLAQATRQRSKQIQAIVDRNALAVKRALAVATAVKEQDKENASLASDRLGARLDLAVERRSELFATPRSRIDTSSAARAAATLRSGAALSLEAKRRTLDAAMDRAVARRDASLAAIASSASACSVKRDTAVAAHAEAAGARRALFDKLNGADVRRHQLRLGKQQPKLNLPELIVVEVHPTPRPAAPTALVSRLMVKQALVVVARRAVVASRVAAKSKPSTADRAKAAAGRRAAAASTRAAKLAAAGARTADVLAVSRRARVAAAKKFNARLAQAAVRRAAKLIATKRKATVSGRIAVELATGRRAARLLAATAFAKVPPRASAAAARRAAAEEARAARAAVLASRCGRAEARRAELLAQRVARAHPLRLLLPMA